jgi:hypothetical protein
VPPALAWVSRRRESQARPVSVWPTIRASHYNEDINRSLHDSHFSSTGGLSPQTGVDSTSKGHSHRHLHSTPCSTHSRRCSTSVIDVSCSATSTRVRLRQLLIRNLAAAAASRESQCPKRQERHSCTLGSVRPTHPREIFDITNKAVFLWKICMQGATMARKYSHFPPTHSQTVHSACLGHTSLFFSNLLTIQGFFSQGVFQWQSVA